MRISRLAIILASLVVPRTSLSQGSEFLCTYSRRSVCDPNRCQPVAVQRWFLLLPTNLYPDNPNAQVRVCDSTGCEPITVRVEETGDLLRIGSVSSGYLLVIARAAVDSFTMRTPHSGGLDTLRVPRMRHVPGHCLRSA